MSSAAADHWAWLLVLSFVFGCNVLRILLPSFSSFRHSSSPRPGFPRSLAGDVSCSRSRRDGSSRPEGHILGMSRVLQKDAEQESQMRAEIQDMKQELSTVNMMDEFARYARLERKINKMTDKLKTHVKARTAQLAKIKWVISVAFYVLQVNCEVTSWRASAIPLSQCGLKGWQDAMRSLEMTLFFSEIFNHFGPYSAALMISLIWKYYSVPVAVVPSKWITPLDRLVAFPTRVAGGVGITCWILVCNKVVAIVLHPFS
ncbi:tail-anchored protein insertion receptor WRB isoform X3 [Sapajus apella]|uniref:Guided entry of tail-anchored proteins factor 1 n=1 Tax=Sapajus apella TaxID=9515 RepID=A0A6J3HRP3_SAPAP|nr:tail-anchored protein insertion receptor WRB isoform X3 [Sapajus apella]